MNNRSSISDNMFVLNQKPEVSRQVLRKAKLMQYHVQMAQIQVNLQAINQNAGMGAPSPDKIEWDGDSLMVDQTQDFSESTFSQEYDFESINCQDNEYEQIRSTKSHGLPELSENFCQEPPVISRCNIETLKEIGDGMHAKIYLAKRWEEDSQELICVKVFKPYQDADQINCAEEEFRVSKILANHPNIIKINSFQQQMPIKIDGIEQTRDFLTLDYCENSDLFEFMSKYAKNQADRGLAATQGKGMLVKDLKLLKSLYLQLIDGISALHGAGYAHMDIKLENILISKEGILKFCDFGFSMPATEFVSKKMGTQAYMAPEIYNAYNLPCKALPTDVFSLGVLFFMMAFGAPPFQSAEFSDGYYSYLKLRPGNTEFFRFHPHTRQLYSRGQIPVAFMQMVLAMLMAEPTQRVQEVAELKQFEFFKDSQIRTQHHGATELVQHIAIMAQC